MFFRIVTGFIALHFLAGGLLLPFCDFSLMPQLPDMYNICRSTEDKDMTFADFITDHLLNFDCLTDKHPSGDEQKPHTPFSFHFSSTQIAVYYLVPVISPAETQTPAELPMGFNEQLPASDYYNSVFHPPSFTH